MPTKKKKKSTKWAKAERVEGIVAWEWIPQFPRGVAIGVMRLIARQGVDPHGVAGQDWEPSPPLWFAGGFRPFGANWSSPATRGLAGFKNKERNKSNFGSGVAEISNSPEQRTFRGFANRNTSRNANDPLGTMDRTGPCQVPSFTPGNRRQVGKVIGRCKT